MRAHRLDTNLVYPVGQAACICGRHGNREEILLHIMHHLEDGSPVIVSDDFGGGDTKAHYVPTAPRRPATRPPCRDRECLAPLNTAGACAVHFAESMSPDALDLLTEPDPALTPVPDASSRKIPSIAEAFQSMLRSAYLAGSAGAAIGETFETWYQREVLR